jgi:tetratricopeptide (TPR) repeat protein
MVDHPMRIRPRPPSRALPILALLATAFSIVPLAYADGDKGTGKKKHDEDSSSATGKSGSSSDYRKACDTGNGKYAARDFPGAIEQYRKAIELSPKLPLAFYLLGEAQLAAGSMTEADAAWTRAAAESEDDAVLHARVLFVIADLRERQLKWDDARAAWQAYLDWANRNPKANAFPTSAQSRQQVIDSMKKQDKDYEVVRRRIEETKSGNVFTDLSKSPPAGH